VEKKRKEKRGNCKAEKSWVATTEIIKRKLTKGQCWSVWFKKASHVWGAKRVFGGGGTGLKRFT